MPLSTSPGGNREIIGKVVIQYVTEGLSEATELSEKFRGITERVSNIASNMVKSANWSVLAKDARLFHAANIQAERGTKKWSQSLEEAGGILAFVGKEGRKAFEKHISEYENLAKAIGDAASRGQELMESPAADDILKTTEKLQGMREEFETMDKAKESLNEKWKATIEIFEEVKVLAKEMYAGFKPDNLEDAGEVITALGAGFQKSFQLGKKFGGWWKKFAKERIAAAVKANKAGGGGFGGFLKGLVSMAAPLINAIQGVAKLGAQLMAMGPAGIAVIAVILAVGVALLGLALAMGAAVAAIKLGIAGFKQLIKLDEEYRKSAYRSIGTMREVTNATLEMAQSNELSIESNRKAVSAMVEAGISGATLSQGFTDLTGKVVTGNEAFKAAGSNIAEIARTTGLAEGPVAGFSKAMFSLGEGVDGTRIAMGRLMKVQKLMGLSQKAMGSALSFITKNQAKFQTSLRGTEPKQFAQDLGVMYAAAEQAGVGIENVDEMVTKMSSGLNEGAIVLAAFAGKMDTFMSSTNAAELAQVGFEGALEFYDMFKGNARVLEDMQQKWGITNKQILTARGLVGDLVGKELKDFEDSQALDVFNKNLETATGSFKQMLMKIFGPLLAKAAEKMQPLMDNFIKLSEFVKEEIQPVLYEMGELIEEIFGGDMTSEEGLKEAIKGVLGFIKEVIVVTKTLVPIVKAVAKFFWEWKEYILAIWAGPIGMIGLAVYKIGKAVGFWGSNADQAQKSIKGVGEAIDEVNNKGKGKESDLDAYKKALKAGKVNYLDKGVKDYYSKRGVDITTRLAMRRGRPEKAAAAAMKEDKSGSKVEEAKKELATGGDSRKGKWADLKTREAAYFKSQGKSVPRSIPAPSGGPGWEPDLLDKMHYAASSRGKKKAKSSTIPTVKYSGVISGKMNVLIDHVKHTNIILDMILEKSDPGLQELNESMKEIKEAKRTMHKGFRKSDVMGSNAHQWGASQ